jgi:hypothetical protein
VIAEKLTGFIDTHVCGAYRARDMRRARPTGLDWSPNL